MQKTKETRAIRYSLDDRIYNCICAVLTIFTVVVIIYPLYFVLIASFSDPNIVNSGKVMLFPEGISFKGYERVFQDARIWRSYLNTIIYTVGGTIFGTICTVMAGYALSRDDLPGTGIIMRPLIFAMYFSGGMIPGYLMIQSYHLLNTRLLMIILGSISVYNIIIVRTFMKNSIPSDLYDAATIDGCGNWKFFIKIVVPLSKPVIAVMVLYIAVMHWNSYFNAMLFLSDTALQPLQVYLRELLMFTTTMTQNTTLLNNPEALQVMQETATQLKYPYLTVSILNPTKGEIDSVRMKIGEIVSRSCRSTNPNLRNTEPHIWVDGKTPQWYACCPGSRDYTLLANATAEYLSVFELTHERVQNRQHTQKMKGADAHAR